MPYEKSISILLKDNNILEKKQINIEKHLKYCKIGIINAGDFMENTQQINEALSLTNQIIPLVEESEQKLRSARNWGVLDIFGGGLLTDLIKHSKINNASRSMDQVNYLMQRLQVILGSINIPEDYRMQTGNFSTFGDFLFDGAIFDIYMFSKIMNSLNRVSDLKNKLYMLRNSLQRMLK